MEHATQSEWQAEQLQPAISQRLKKTMAQSELAHAYLFAGPSGSGKKALAQWMALRLFCEHSEAGEPDGTCSECQRILSGNHPDVVVAAPEGRQIKVDTIRRLKAEFGKSAMEGSQKLFIIEDAEKMTTSAANSLLKFIEEPLPGIYILLLTTNKSAVLPTIRSRTQIIELQPLPKKILKEKLNQIKIPTGLQAIALGLTDSTEQIEEWMADDWFNQAVQAVIQWYKECSRTDLIAFVMVQTTLLKTATDRERQMVILDLMALIWRDTLMVASGISENDSLHFIDQLAIIQETAQRYRLDQLLQVSELTLETRHLMDQNVSFQNTAEQLSLRIINVLQR
ncbi:DNA polymerase III subunit delta' [Limosilactobacillus mucosae]|nr:DNA polymerase III subunit delta' [Lactobacillus sp.]